MEIPLFKIDFTLHTFNYCWSNITLYKIIKYENQTTHRGLKDGCIKTSKK